MPDEVKEAIRERTDLAALVGETVELKRSGTRFKGLCPFHDEKTPSFTVDPSRGRYHCFGCGEDGDAIGFVRETRGLSFMDTLRFLGGRVGIEIPEVEVSEEEEAAARERREHKEWLLKANELAAAYFELSLNQPAGTAARAYLDRRAIGDDVRKRFRLGYAPDSWDALVDHLVERGVSVRYIVETGLAKPRAGGDGQYAFFRNRLVCPVRDAYGRVVAFSARALAKEDEERGKYINSPESPVFQKRKLLFGLEQARPSIRGKGRAVLVEGNFDVLSMHEAGFTETVASLGTALTSEQVGVLNRQTDSVLLLYDGDPAGRKSALKGVPLFVDEDLMVRVATLPPGQDPDDLLKASGPAALDEVLAAALPGVEFAIREILPRRGAAPEDKQRAVAAIGRLVGRVRGPLARAEYRRLTSGLLGVPENELDRYFRGAPPPEDSWEVGGRRAKPEQRHRAAELVRLLVDAPQLIERVESANVVDLVRDGALRTALRTLLDLHASGRPTGGGALLEALEDPARARVAEVLAVETVRDRTVPPSQLLETVLVQFGRRWAKTRDEESMRELQQADEDAERQLLFPFRARGEEKRRRQVAPRAETVGTDTPEGSNEDL